MNLLNCPFCGQPPHAQGVYGNDPTGERYGYYCIECLSGSYSRCKVGLFVGVHTETKEEAIVAWNTRIDSVGRDGKTQAERMYEIAKHEIHDELDELKKELSHLRSIYQPYGQYRINQSVDTKDE